MVLTRLFKEFFSSEKTGGLILLGCTVLSVIIANSAYGESYAAFWHSHVDLSFLSVTLDHSLEHWINDGLMTIFFLLVGLEIERELYRGELSAMKNALLPAAAALGGMLVPAGIYFLVTAPSGSSPGFGIPMATDIAFALGMLSLAGDRIPFPLKIFLTALAIIDDLGAILVIAIFYSGKLSPEYLGSALGIFLLLMALNKRGVKGLPWYLIPGLVMWYCMLRSGVHATISGVLLAFALPFSHDDAVNPSYRLQRFLHKPVAFLILPLFALANTGIVLAPGWATEMLSANNLGIMAGLLIGKPLGILLFSGLMIWLKIAGLPRGVGWKLFSGVAVLAGIGFTMSIFITNLAFSDEAAIRFSKIAVLIASLIATGLGLWILLTTRKPPSANLPSD